MKNLIFIASTLCFVLAIIKTIQGNVIVSELASINGTLWLIYGRLV